MGHRDMSKAQGLNRPLPLAASCSVAENMLQLQQEFSVYVAPERSLLLEKIEAKESIWCGWNNFLGLGEGTCVARTSPFGQTHIGVVLASPQYLSGKPL